MKDRWRSFVVPAAAGLLLVPAAAVAGTRMLTAADEAPDLGSKSMSYVSVPATAPSDATAPDPVAVACGDEAAQLLADEQAGTLDPVGQAALDALRPVCEQAGMPLPAAPEPDPVVVTEQIPVPAPAPTAPAVAAAPSPQRPASSAVVHLTASSDDDEHDDDDDHEDDDHEDEDHDERDDDDEHEDD